MIFYNRKNSRKGFFKNNAYITRYIMELKHFIRKENILMRKSKKMVEENIASLSSSLETLVPGTEEYSKAAESLAKLYKVVTRRKTFGNG